MIRSLGTSRSSFYKVWLVFIHFSLELQKFQQKEIMFRRKLHGGSSSKKGPHLSIREPDPYQLRDAPVQPCEWPSDEFMIEAGFKDEFDTLVRNFGLEEFL